VSGPAAGADDGAARERARVHAKAAEVFLAARALPPEARAAEVERLCDGDASVRAEALSLLAHDLPDGGPSGHAPRARSGDAPPAALEPGSRLGPYRILGRIGQGASGQVFLAEQEEPIRRRVAIKVVPLAAASPALLARFEVERAALERTEHPGVARILDAGRTPAGIPYLVLELVEGPPITSYCRERGLGPEELVRLVLAVAEAVQHAHQRGVIHRDLKPGNVLVAEVGGRAQPRVLDFGIAKLAEAATGELPPTSGLPIGTPAYMAPEQTTLEPVDIRADVYALGALAYELVAGRPPVATGGDPLEALRRIREQVPEPASLARARAGLPAGAPRAFLRDLDAILAKALEKPRERRYATVEAFAQDLRRLLASEPIAARPPTPAYRAARFARRNRLAVGAGALVLAALTVGGLGLVLGLLEARRERAEALAQSESQREINRFLTDDLLSAASPERDGAEITALELLERASGLVDDRFPDQPLVAASLHQTLSTAFGELGAFDDAERHAARALELRRAAAGPDAPDTVRSEIAAASLIARRERYAEAEPALDQAVSRSRAILGPQDPDLYAALNDLGIVLEYAGRPAEALPILEEALDGRSRLLPPASPEVLETINNLAQAFDALGQTERALELLLDALARCEGAGEVPRFTLLHLCNNVGATYQDLGRDREAEPYLTRAADLADEMLGADHPATLIIQGNLAALQAELGDVEAAIELSRRVVAGQTQLYGATAYDTLAARHGYWDAVQLAGRHGEASRGFEGLLADCEASLGPDHWLSAATAASLASALFDEGRADEASLHAERAEQRLRALYPADHHRVKAVEVLAADIARARTGSR
jgi:tetratricopeptide (TPR) repeat protein